jgi:hypothetical protein
MIIINNFAISSIPDHPTFPSPCLYFIPTTFLKIHHGETPETPALTLSAKKFGEAIPEMTGNK